MMKNLKLSCFCLLFLSAMPALSQLGNSGTAPTNGGQEQKNPAAHNTQQRDGQKVFEQNCSRCHNAPQGFSPSISGTVVRHMRVRAGLSKEDAQAVLRFLNP
jgi:mono/diheme cytochrome c family protein